MRELVALPPPHDTVKYHSLLAETGGDIQDYREFVVRKSTPLRLRVAGYALIICSDI